MEVAPGVHRFDTGPFNWYLVRERGRFTLIDAGFPGHFETLRQGLRGLHAELKDIDAIVLTHAHADHTGMVERVRAASGATVFIHEADRAAVQRPLQLPWWGLLSNAWRGYTRAMLLHAARRGVFTAGAVGAVHPLRDGQQLEIPGRPRVIHTPGHTPGQIVLLLADGATLLCGDTLVTRHLLTGVEGPPQICPSVLNSDDDAARRSVAVLSRLGPLTLLPGHGRPWTGEIAEAIERTKLEAA